MTQSPQESIVVVVPFTTWNDYVIECVKHCSRQTFRDFTIWLLPNEAPTDEWKEKLRAIENDIPIHIEATGPGNPARKRNIAMQRSGGSVFAFIDSDAYPKKDWLSQSLPLLKESIAIVAGPNITPDADPFLKRIPGLVMASPWGFGSGYIRHTFSSRQIVDEMPSCNMISRPQEAIFFREELDTSEDMRYCADTRRAGKKILYDPSVVVYHHRRSLFRPFAKQFFLYGLDKGALAKRDSASTHLWQAFPSLLLLYSMALILVAFFPLPDTARYLVLLPAAIYGAFVLIEGVRKGQSLTEGLLAPFAFLAAHLSYGFGYLVGFLKA